ARALPGRAAAAQRRGLAGGSASGGDRPAPAALSRQARRRRRGRRRGPHPDGPVLRQAGGARAVRRRAVGHPARPSAGGRGHLLRRHLLERGRAAPPRYRRGGGDAVTDPWPADVLEQRIRDLLAERYHDRHPFNRRMHEGTLSPEQLRGWAANRFYYQQVIPVKDAVLLSKLPWEYRREWIRRIIDHDGSRPGEGGLEAWLRLGEAVGLRRTDLLEHRFLVP